MSVRAAVSCLSLLLLGGCLRVEVTRNGQPGPAFAAARREALRHQGEPGPARELGAVVWSADGQQLVRVRVPMWLVRKLGRSIDRETGSDREQAGERERGDEWDDRLARRLRLKDLDRAGLGLLFEMEEEQGERVLVWLQ